MILSVSTHRGQFITFEGLDGCGKSTQMEKLATALRAQGLASWSLANPAGLQPEKKFASSCSTPQPAALSPMAELALMFASRAQHIKEVIQPALAEGRIVLVTASPIPPKRTREAAESWAVSRCWRCIESSAGICNRTSPS